MAASGPRRAAADRAARPDSAAWSAHRRRARRAAPGARLASTSACAQYAGDSGQSAVAILCRLPTAYRLQNPADRGDDVLLVRQRLAFEALRVRQRDVLATHPLRGRIEVVERGVDD